MNNTVQFIIRDDDYFNNNSCEKNQANINLTITLPEDRIEKLISSIEKLDKSNIQAFPENLISLISDAQPSSSYIEPFSELESAVTVIMNELGIPAHTKGYRYLRDAIVLSTENPELIGKVTKVIYPTIAQNHNTTPVRVERVIRHAIENCCLKGNAKLMNTLFSHCLSSSRGKPTNSEFIAILSDKLRMYA